MRTTLDGEPLRPTKDLKKMMVAAEREHEESGETEDPLGRTRPYARADRDQVSLLEELGVSMLLDELAQGLVPVQVRVFLMVF
jgi:hypothetical protein